MFKLIISGNLTAAPEGKTISGDIRVANFTVAVNHWVSGKESVEYVRCTCWRNNADKVEKYLNKGSKVICWGKPSTHAWNDSKDGSARAAMELSVDEIEFIGNRPVEKSVENTEQPVENSTSCAEDDSLPF